MLASQIRHYCLEQRLQRLVYTDNPRENQETKRVVFFYDDGCGDCITEPLWASRVAKEKAAKAGKKSSK